VIEKLEVPLLIDWCLYAQDDRAKTTHQASEIEAMLSTILNGSVFRLAMEKGERAPCFHFRSTVLFLPKDKYGGEESSSGSLTWVTQFEVLFWTDALRQEEIDPDGGSE
jgi:hypothetical protein